MWIIMQIETSVFTREKKNNVIVTFFGNTADLIEKLRSYFIYADAR